MKVATINLRTLTTSLLVPLAAGAASALISGANSSKYAAMNQPPLSPPGWVFPVVWTILYLLMGYAAYRIRSAKSYEKDAALRLYYIQLAINVLWPIFFFRFQWPVASIFVLAALLIAVALTFLQFRRIDRTAANLLIPYLIWLVFALYLNIGVAVLSR